MREEQFIRAIKRRKRKDQWYFVFLLFMGFLSLFPLFSVLYYVVSKGWFDLFSAGFLKPTVGTLEMVLIAMVFAIPLGTGLGLYLYESRGTRMVTVVRYTADLLSGIPSILIGMAVYAVVVISTGTFSLFAGSVALATFSIPYLGREIEDQLIASTSAIKEGALALGATNTRALLQMVMPVMTRPLIVAILFSMSRAMGETAPLLFTTLGNHFWPIGLMSPASTLSLQIYFDALSPNSFVQSQAWTGALILIAFIILLFLVAKWITREESK